jgi:hypothetical protein
MLGEAAMPRMNASLKPSSVCANRFGESRTPSFQIDE